MIEGISTMVGVHQKDLISDQKPQEVESRELTSSDAGAVAAPEVPGGNVPPTESLPDSNDQSASYGESHSQQRTSPDWSKGSTVNILG